MNRKMRQGKLAAIAVCGPFGGGKGTGGRIVCADYDGKRLF